MQDAAREILLDRLGPDDLVLDVGGWADPFERADWVIDLFPYRTRGMYQRRGWARQRTGERFSEETWIERDLCDREPLPFGDRELDFVICSHTLEDIRDPVWVCSEMQRIARAGYIEVPSRLEEQSWGVVGQFVGWPHHHWLIDVGEDAISFVHKTHAIHGLPDCYFPQGFASTLDEAERVQSLWWEGSFAFEERIIFDEQGEQMRAYLSELVEREIADRGFKRAGADSALSSRVRARLAGLLGRAS